MTINHLYIYVQAHRMAAMRSFYKDVLKPLGYNEMIYVNNGSHIGFGSDFPYIFLRAAPGDDKQYPAHVAIDAPSNEAVDEFHALGLKHGGTDNGKPGIRPEMSRQPYYAAYLLDPDGNNLEAVRVNKAGTRDKVARSSSTET